MKLSILNEMTISRAIVIDNNVLENSLGFTIGKKYKEGGFAVVFHVEGDNNKLIKITSDHDDILKLIKANKNDVSGVPIIYSHTTNGIKNGIAAVVQKIDGNSIKYSNMEMHALVGGRHGNDSIKNAMISILKPNDIRLKILESHNSNNKKERYKLYYLFETIMRLNKLGIYIDDYDDNVIDNGDKYIIIDLGM